MKILSRKRQARRGNLRSRVRSGVRGWGLPLHERRAALKCRHLKCPNASKASPLSCSGTSRILFGIASKDPGLPDGYGDVLSALPAWAAAGTCVPGSSTSQRGVGSDSPERRATADASLQTAGSTARRGVRSCAAPRSLARPGVPLGAAPRRRARMAKASKTAPPALPTVGPHGMTDQITKPGALLRTARARIRERH